MKPSRTFCLPKEFSRWRGVRRQAIEETKIGDFLSRKIAPRRGPFHGDREQNCDSSALGSVQHLPITNSGNPEAGLFSDLPFQRSLERFVSLNLPPGNVQSFLPTVCLTSKTEPSSFSIHAITETSFFGLNAVRFCFAIP